ncbi:response regulator [Telmatospirillum sp.]|uniref:response regulator n=1 Tax=Telmatospirillum sp. TaxID=2079197 RepID=UPI00284A06F5|nr:response regulator [Telmatospirillum sp.]MDR3436012.1 response regulator [Telmatospirillum sp.]
MPLPKIATILIVDDDESNIKLLQTLLRAEGYATLTARNGLDALAVTAAEQPDLILLDIMMPNMDGFETVARLKANPKTQPVPVIMVTSLNDRGSKLRALEAGAEEFLNKPLDRADLRVRVRNLLRLKEYGDFLANHNRLLEQKVGERTRQLEEAYRDTVFTLVQAAEYRDEETGQHVRRISHYCRDLAETRGLDGEFRDHIAQASPMHDIGKIGIPDYLLLKPGPFEPEEWVIMKTHAAHGAQILAQGSSPYTRMGAEIALCHHERWGGDGYPNGLKGEEIPLAARIMQICDVYDALRSCRRYKPAFDHARTIEIITNGDGRTRPEHFDPAILASFVACADRFACIFAEHADPYDGTASQASPPPIIGGTRVSIA